MIPVALITTNAVGDVSISEVEMKAFTFEAAMEIIGVAKLCPVDVYDPVITPSFKCISLQIAQEKPFTYITYVFIHKTY